MTVEEFYRRKFREWYSKGNGNYTAHLRNLRKDGIKRELRSDATFKQEVCDFVRKYAQNQERDVVASVLKDVMDYPDADIINLVVAATLEVCFPDSTKTNELVGNVVGGVIIAAVVVGLLALIFGRK